MLRIVHDSLTTLSLAGLAEIQEKIIEKSGRNLFSRLVHAKDDKDTIASWRSDLNRILLVFNVRSAISAWLSPTVHFQSELAIDTSVNVSDVRHNVTNTRTVVVNTHTVVANTHTTVAGTHAVVSNTNTVVANTHTPVSDIHRNLLQNQERTDSQQQSVGATPYSSTTDTEHLPSPRFESGQRSRIS